MNDKFVRVGPLMDPASYPVWAQELMGECEEAKQRVVSHELFHMMRETTLTLPAMRNFLAGVWPVIEQFPQYMALNLLKVRYGRTLGQDMARKYLIRNIRVEQNHADYWIAWAAACGVSQEDLLYGSVPLATHALSHWCWHTCERDGLAASMAATNYAIEGATGEWAQLVCSSDAYENSFDPSVRKNAMRWLKAHAHYDDAHPWEALDIICTIMGENPAADSVRFLGAGVRKSHEYMRMTLDYCLLPNETGSQGFSTAIPMQQRDRRRG
jgi:pyrroloquinoline quinone (PQQ) biosynthesis protein C